MGANTGKVFDDEWCVNMSKAHAGKEYKEARRFDESVEKEICKLYSEDKMTAYALGKKFNVKANLVSSILERYGVQKHESNYTGHSNGRNRLTPEQELLMCQEYMSGATTRAALAKKYGIGSTTVRSILLRNNIKL